MSEQKSRNPIILALVTLASVGGGWQFFRNFEVSGLDSISLRPRNSLVSSEQDSPFWSALTDASQSISPTASQSHRAILGQHEGVVSTLASVRSPAVDAANESIPTSAADQGLTPLAKPIRIGSWALAGFDRNKLAKPHVMDKLSRVVRQFDVMALQQITSVERDLLPRMIAHVNQTGRHYDFLLGPMVGPHGADIHRLGEQYAFLFDADRIEIDRGQTYTVADPGNQVAYDPLVGWFRVRGVPTERAWTFTLVNFRVDSTQPHREVALVAKLMDSVAQDGRNEDDLLLTGMFHADDRQLLTFLGSDSTHAAVLSTPTDIFGRYQLSNILAPKKTTTEYLGRGGVVDFPRAFNMTEAEAEEVSPHLPVYAEFTATEGN